MKFPLPDAALQQHIAILGKTGSGKSTTAKGCIEHIVRTMPGARICILDPIKSDWWGLTSSADGRHPGLPFHILGGPRGHVPLHPSAGKAIGELVGNGGLPLSIVDMADFPPGGLSQFFNDFAPALMRAATGVVYLVLEEAHEFAPKERAGVGAETMAIYNAKKLATAGRSKGIRLMVLTQRTQALHNAVLGSCDTMIAHRLTAPADQNPVKDWLRAHVDKPTFEMVAGSLASLPTGTAWVCSGEVQLAEKIAFPGITTFDNSATPTIGSTLKAVTTAPVDQDKLRAIIGDAVEQAEANDPAALKARIKELEAEVAKKPRPEVDDAALLAARQSGFRDGLSAIDVVRTALGQNLADAEKAMRAIRDALDAPLPDKQSQVASPAPTPGVVHRQAPYTPPPPRPASASPTGPGDGTLTRGERAVLTVLAQFHPQPIKPKRAAAISGYSIKASTWRGILASLRKREAITGSDDLGITPAGLAALGSFTPLPTGAALLEHWIGELPKGQAETLKVLAAIGGHGAAADVAGRAGYSTSASTWRGILAGLRNLCLVDGSRVLKLHEDLR